MAFRKHFTKSFWSWRHKL